MGRIEVVEVDIACASDRTVTSSSTDIYPGGKTAPAAIGGVHHLILPQILSGTAPAAIGGGHHLILPQILSGAAPAAIGGGHHLILPQILSGTALHTVASTAAEPHESLVASTAAEPHESPSIHRSHNRR